MATAKLFLYVFSRFAHHSCIFGPFFHADCLKRCDGLVLSLGNSDFQLPPQVQSIGLTFRDWHDLQNLEMSFFCSHSFVSSSTYLRSSSWWKICHVSSSMLPLIERSFSPKSHHTWSHSCQWDHVWLSCSPHRKVAPNHDVTTPMLIIHTP